jgi:hypothetical protein
MQPHKRLSKIKGKEIVMKKKILVGKMLALTVASFVLVFIALGCAEASTPAKQTEGVLKIQDDKCRCGTSLSG